ncbi:MAG: fatty acid desaturase [Candidatus Rokuibacteriota bacterium]
MTERAVAIPWRLNLVIAAAQIAVLGAILWTAGGVSVVWCALVLAPLWGIVMNAVYSLIHEAEHNLFHPDPRVNDAAGVVLAALFPAPFHLLRQGHLGHHLRNRSDDEAFDLYFPEDSALWKRVQLYGILAGFYWAAVALSSVVALIRPSLLRPGGVRFDRPTAALLESLNPRYERLIRLEALAIVLLHGAVTWLLSVPVAHYVIVLYGFGLSWSGFQYVHHFGTVRDVRRGARNLETWALLDLVWLNHNYHLNHHLHPTVPWIHLPALAVGPEGERASLVRAYARMWRGPRLTTVRVQNPYAGLVVR